jgi:maltooligosyltrehalose trehalohydrolase
VTHTFRVWAPDAHQVDVDVRGSRYALVRDDWGWWTAGVADAGPGDDYQFIVDGGDALPDPRSSFQPGGVHGPSRLIDHGAYVWNDAGWRGFALRDAVIYELHTGTFTQAGTFDGVVERLDHLVTLGVNAIELMPVGEFAGVRGWGYDGVDLFAPHHAYGGPEALKRLVDACHARGVAVVIDVVYNHVGPEGNYLGMFGPYFTKRYATPWGDAMNYDGPDSDEVRAFVIDNALMWLRDYHCDGLRLDAVHEIVDTSATHILEEVVTRVEALRDEVGRELWVIAESDLNDPRLVRDRVLGGYGVSAQWSDNFHHAVHALLTGESNGYYADFGSPNDVCTALRQGFVYTGQYSHFRRRRFGRPVGELPLHRFLGYAQNHDQVGNRAAGDRLCQVVSAGRARIAAALALLAPFVPLLFQGEEWAASTPFQYFTDFGDRALQQAVSAGRRHEFRDFGWAPEAVPDPTALETFTRSRLLWEEVSRREHAAMLDWYRALIALRKATPRLRESLPAEVRAWHDEDRSLLFYENAGLFMVCNLGNAPADIGEAAGSQLVLSSAPLGDHAGVWRCPPDAVAVWSRQDG